MPTGAVARLGTIRLRHSQAAQDVTFSPKGECVASCGYDGVAAIWDVATGKQIERFQSKWFCKAVAYSPDGKILAIASYDTVSLRALPSGREEVIRSGVKTLRFSPDSKLLATAGGCDIKLWDVATREVVRKWRFRDEVEIQAIAFSPDGNLLAWGYGESPGKRNPAPVRLLDISTGKTVRELNGDLGRVTSLTFSPDGKTLVSSAFSDEGTLRLWNVASGDEVWSDKTAWSTVAFSPDGKVIAEAGSQKLHFRRAADGKVLHQAARPPYGISAVQYSPDGKKVVTAGGHTIDLWDAASGKRVTPVEGPEGGVLCVAFSPDGKVLAVRESPDVVNLYGVSALKPLRRLGEMSEVAEGGGEDSRLFRTRTLAFSPNGSLLAAIGPYNGTAYVWGTSEGKLSRTVRIRDRHVASVGFASDDSLLLAAGPKDSLTLWSLRDGDKPQTLNLSTERVLGALIPPGGRVGAAAVLGRRLCWFNAATGEELDGNASGELPVGTLAFSADGKLLVTAGGEDQEVLAIWDVPTGKLVCKIKGHKGSVFGIAFAPDGRTVVSAGAADKTVRFWSARTGEELAKREGHTGAVYTVAFSPDGRIVASGSADGTVLLWDTKGIAPPPAKAPAESELKGLYSDLTAGDLSRVYAAVDSLSAGGDKALVFLRGTVKPLPEPNPKRVKELVGDLDNEDFDTRAKAQSELAGYEAAVEPLLSEALTRDPSKEKKLRLEALLQTARDPRPVGEQLRTVRVIQTLERMGSPGALEVLESLAKGATASNLTREARAAADRLKHRLHEKP